MKEKLSKEQKQELRKANKAFNEWKNDLFTRIVGQGDE